MWHWAVHVSIQWNDSAVHSRGPIRRHPEGNMRSWAANGSLNMYSSTSTSRCPPTACLSAHHASLAPTNQSPGPSLVGAHTHACLNWAATTLSACASAGGGRAVGACRGRPSADGGGPCCRSARPPSGPRAGLSWPYPAAPAPPPRLRLPLRTGRWLQTAWLACSPQLHHDESQNSVRDLFGTAHALCACCLAAMRGTHC